MKHELTNESLAELRQSLMGYSEHLSHTDAFRKRCAECADLIARYIDGQDVEAACVAALEEVYGPLVFAEVHRLKVFNALDEQVSKAWEDGNPKAWAVAAASALPLMSEAQLRGVRAGIEYLHAQNAIDVRLYKAWVEGNPKASARAMARALRSMTKDQLMAAMTGLHGEPASEPPEPRAVWIHAMPAAMQ